VDLALRGAGTDGGPGQEVGEVLRGHRLEQLGRGGQPQLPHVDEETAGELESGADVVATVQVRVVDQSLPAHRGARFLEVAAHDHEQVVLEFAGEGRQELGVLEARPGVVDGAGADDHEQPRILAAQDPADVLPAPGDGPQDVQRGGNGLAQGVGGDETLERVDVTVLFRGHIRCPEGGCGLEGACRLEGGGHGGPLRRARVLQSPPE
jgi:hypothetical protein